MGRLGSTVARLKLKGIGGGAHKGGGCGLIRFNARNLTRDDSRMKVRLMVLPDKLSGGAWLSSVRGVSCPLKCGNEQDSYPMLQQASFEAWYS